MRRMKSTTTIAGLAILFVLLLTVAPALLPGTAGARLQAMVSGVFSLLLNAVWTIALAYVGARLALRHERARSR